MQPNAGSVPLLAYHRQYNELKKICAQVVDHAKGTPEDERRDILEHADAAREALEESRARLSALREGTEEEWARAKQDLEQKLASARRHLSEC